MQGTIKVLKNGFGFIKSDEAPDGKDVFFHVSQLVDVEFDSLEEGNEVNFEVAEGNEGKSQAVNVSLV